MKNLGFIMIFLLLLVGCETETADVPVNEQEVFELKGVTPPTDTQGRTHEGINYYTGDVVNAAFSTRTIENTQAVDKFRQAVEIFNTNMEGCVQIEFLNVATESFTDTDNINKGSSFTLETIPDDLVGINSKYIRTYITKNEVPAQHVANYGEGFVDRIVGGGLIEFTSDNTFELVYKFPFSLDGIKIKYLDPDGVYEGNQVEAGLETTFYSEYGYQGQDLVKVRNERVNFSAAPAGWIAPVYASLGKTWQINGHPTVFTDVVMVAEDLDLDVYVRMLAYEFGQESAMDSPADFEQLRTLMCNE